MSTSINTNISAIAAQNSLRTTGLKQDSAMERLSTGIRINNAKDDAAGLAISTRMTANIRGIAAAIRNANDGISLTQTAEGSLNAIGDNLQRIRELAVQSANSSNTVSDRNALNAEATQLVAEIDRVASNSSFNGIKLLDGSYKNQSLQIGAGNDSNDRITISIGNAKASALGVGVGAAYGKTITPTGNVSAVALTSGDISINGYQVGASSSDGVSSKFATTSGIAKAAAINQIAQQTGVNAAVGSTTLTGIAATGTTATAASDLNINGVDIGVIAAVTVADVGAARAIERGNQVAAAINAKSAETGVTATSDSSNGIVSLVASDGRNVVVKTTDAGAKATGFNSTAAGDTTVTFTGSVSSGATVVFAGLTFTATGGATTAQIATVFSNLTAGMTAASANLAASAALVTSTVGTFTGTLEAGYTSGAATGQSIKFTAGSTATTRLAVTGTSTAAGTSSIAVDAESLTTSKITLSTSSKDGINLAGAASKIGTTSGQYNSDALQGVDLTTALGSQAALTVLDKAINTVTDSRASLGAYQNRLTASISNLETSSMNLQASRSRILDTDYAKETTNLAKAQIIQQAATAMLAQANQSAQSVLALLK
jgi:flagellin